MMDLHLVLPDGTECAYGPVPDGFQPAVGERVAFSRSDPLGKLAADDCGVEDMVWVVLGREWHVRLKPLDKLSENIVFLSLRLGRVA